jgi:Uma2 family endonuclease
MATGIARRAFSVHDYTRMREGGILAEDDRVELGEKIPRYAAVGVPEAWIVDLTQQMVEQYTAPAHGQYTRVARLFPSDTLTSPVAPAIALPVGMLVG